MARTTDRQFVSEAVRISESWIKSFATPNCVILTRVGSMGDDRLIVDYGATGRIKTASRVTDGEYTSFINHKRQTVLDIIAQ